MANPNIANLTNITAKTAVAVLTNSSTALITNLVGSDKVIKINSIYVSNVNGVTASDFTLDVYRNGVAYRIAYLISVPAKTVLDVLNKLVYLEEGDSLRVTASSNNYLEVVCSYEEIS
jgi:hypothetical protein